MTEIKIVSGLNYGDESKGLVAHFVSTSNSLTIMPSNSCQRAHTVVYNGIRKVFRHFGSGTLKGAATYFTDKFYINPAMFRQEWNSLVEMGITPTVYVRAGAIFITPIDMYANVLIEQNRGENSFSSTGCGVWQALCRHKAIGAGDEDFEGTSNYYKKLFSSENEHIKKKMNDFLTGAALEDNIYEDILFFYQHVHVINDDKEEKELFNLYNLIVFENGQGLLLDDDYNADILHNTPAHVGSKIPAEILRKYYKPSDLNIETLYVSRTYFTRHGKGKIGIANDECLREAINPHMVDKTNVPNSNQGTLRYAKMSKYDADMALARAVKDSENLKGFSYTTGIVLTHTNEFQNKYFEHIVDTSNVKLYTSDNEENFK